MLRKKILSILILFLFVFSGCKAKGYQKYSQTRLAMGTTLTVTFFTEDKKKAKAIFDEIFLLANQLEQLFSSRNPHGTIKKINQQSQYTLSDPLLLTTIKQALKIAQLTEGAFDPSLYHLISLWDIENQMQKKDPKIPLPSAIEKVLLKTGYQNLLIKNNQLFLNNQAALDLGAIAKGKIVDQLAKYLDKEAISDYFINGGGDIAVKGLFGGFRKWKIAITNPYRNQEFLGVVNISNVAIVTSGNYERFFISNNQRFHHILDPKTGYPANTGIDSVTVIANDATTADAMATALFVMGEKKGLAFTENYPHLEVIFFQKKQGIITMSHSSGIQASKQQNGQWSFRLKE
ncbi:MAG: FAD:protein FMN transferase [Spirochaetes bacterium]|nr:FAD:protein FMN transferase [Spirochaetota bacterium]